MSTFKKIRGTTVRNNAGDLPSAVNGQLWYDSTNKVFKHKYPNLTSAGSWSTGNALTSGRAEFAGAGIQTSALMFGGGPSPAVGKTESYDGVSFTEVNDLNTARNSLGGAGADNTSAIAFGGGAPADSDKDND